MIGPIYCLAERPIDFEYRVNNCNEYKDIKYALEDIKKSLTNYSSSKYKDEATKLSEINNINALDFGICYIMKIINEAIKENNIAEITVIYYMIALSELDKFKIDNNFYKYFKKIIYILLKIARKNNLNNYNPSLWCKFISRYYLKMMYYLFDESYTKNNYFKRWVTIISYNN